jgi:glycosyltransferase involved in cell wall biosynthesis
MTDPSRVAVLAFGHDASRVGGIEIHTREVARQLGERGWQAILCFHQQPSTEVHQFLSLRNVVWEVLPNGWENSWRSIRALIRILKRHRPRVLHLQFMPFVSLHAWLARMHGVQRILYTDHDSRPEGYSPRLASFWRRITANALTRPVSAVVAVSDYNQRSLSALGFIPATKVRRIYNGADLSHPVVMEATARNFRQRHGIPQDRVLVMQISWLIPQKGILDTLQAARLALDEEPNLHFAFAGDGEFSDQYKRRAVELGIDANVIWTGSIRNPVVEGAFAATDILCQSSRWEEAFGLVIAEAMAFAKPVVATRVGGVPELVLDGETGYLVERGNVGALAQRILLLARNHDLRVRLGRAARKRAEELFDVRKNVDALIDLYETT